MIRLRLTETEVKKILKSLVIQIDTREGDIKHITDWMDKKKIKYQVRKLDFGDYTAIIPKGTIKGIEYDLSFDKHIVIERKKGLDEITSNFSAGDSPRIKKEFAHLRANRTRCFIFVEDNLFDKHLRNGKYKSKYNPQRLYERLKGFEAEYNTIIRPINELYMGSEIYHTLYYQVRHFLLRELNIQLINEEEQMELQLEEE